MVHIKILWYALQYKIARGEIHEFWFFIAVPNYGAIFPMENSILKMFSNQQDIISYKVTMEYNLFSVLVYSIISLVTWNVKNYVIIEIGLKSVALV